MQGSSVRLPRNTANLQLLLTVSSEGTTLSLLRCTKWLWTHQPTKLGTKTPDKMYACPGYSKLHATRHRSWGCKRRPWKHAGVGKGALRHYMPMQLSEVDPTSPPNLAHRPLTICEHALATQNSRQPAIVAVAATAAHEIGQGAGGAPAPLHAHAV